MRKTFLVTFVVLTALFFLQASTCFAADARVFVSSRTYTGDIAGFVGAACGGLTGIECANRECLDMANQAQLGGNWKAWLSAPGTSAVENIQAAADTRFFNMMQELVFPDGDSLCNSGIVTPVKYDENKQAPSDDEVWTGTNQDCTLAVNEHCQSWSNGTDDADGGYGGCDASSPSDWSYF